MTNEQPPRSEGPPASERTDDRPAYEPPRIVKKRSVARGTLFSGAGPPAGGVTAGG